MLSRLVAYAPRPGRTAKEDFFTEAFTGVLERHPGLARLVLSRMVGNTLPCRSQHPVIFETQATYPIPGTAANCRPDLVVRWAGYGDEPEDTHLIFVESKIDSTAHESQLGNYATVLQSRAGIQRTLVFVTLNPEHVVNPDVADVRFRPLYWGDIYRWIKQWRMRDSDPDAGLVDELLTLMEDLHMNFDLTISDLTVAVDYARDARRKLQWVIQKGWEESDIAGQPLLPGKTSSYDDDHGVYVYSRGIGEPAFNICYGFLLNPDQQPGSWRVAFPNEALPFAFVSLYKFQDGDQLLKRHPAEIGNLLATEGWHRVDDKFLARKLFDDMDFNRSELAGEYRNFFVGAINEIVTAFGLRS